jgi:hypothetical protein
MKFIVIALSDPPHYVAEIEGPFGSRRQATEWAKGIYRSDEVNEKDVHFVDGEPVFKVMEYQERKEEIPPKPGFIFNRSWHSHEDYGLFECKLEVFKDGGEIIAQTGVGYAKADEFCSFVVDKMPDNFDKIPPAGDQDGALFSGWHEDDAAILEEWGFKVRKRNGH